MPAHIKKWVPLKLHNTYKIKKFTSWRQSFLDQCKFTVLHFQKLRPEVIFGWFIVLLVLHWYKKMCFFPKLFYRFDTVRKHAMPIFSRNGKTCNPIVSTVDESMSNTGPKSQCYLPTEDTFMTSKIVAQLAIKSEDSGFWCFNNKFSVNRIFILSIFHRFFGDGCPKNC